MQREDFTYLIILEKALENRKVREYVESIPSRVTRLDTQLGPAMKIHFDRTVKKDTFKEYVEAEHIVHYEADVHPDRRELIDTGNSFKAGKIAYFDIETDPRQNSRPDDPVGRILSISFIDADGKEYFICDNDESEMIRQFASTSKQFGALAGWYSLHFDLPYLWNRAIKLNLTPIERFIPKYDWVHIDLLSIYRDLFKRTSRSFSLGEVGKAEGIGDKLVDIGKFGNPVMIWDWFQDDRKMLRKYNMRDCELCKGLDEKLSLSEVFFAIVGAGHTVPRNVLVPQHKTRRDINFLNIIDSLVLHFAGKRQPRYILPSRRYMEYDESHFQGAMVFDVVPGLHENVLCIDFKSMYPSIMRSWNMGIETFIEGKTGENLAPIGSFYKAPKSIFCDIIDHLIEKLEYYKGEMKKHPPNSPEFKACYSQRFAYKKVLLSLYGSIAFPGARFHRQEIAEDITALGREIITIAADIAKRESKLIAGDTDSLFVVSPVSTNIVEYAEQLCNRIIIAVKIKVKQKYNVNFQGSIELDKVFSRFKLTEAKKKYAGIVVWEGGKSCAYIHTTGFELLRGDVGEAAAKYQEELIKMVLTKTSRDIIDQYVMDVRKALFAGKLDQALITYKTLNQDLDEYVVDAPHTTAAKIMLAKGTYVRRGMKIAFVKYGAGKEEVLPITSENFILPKRSYKYIWEHQFLSISERLGIASRGETTLEKFGVTL